jgi:AraC family ethanolamine operon transcriptional activator
VQIPQALPSRVVQLATRDPDAIAAVQPERLRRYEQLTRGSFRGSMLERAFGRAALLRERWSCGMRVRCDRPAGYTVFAVPMWASGGARWCGAALSPGLLVRTVEPWELSTSGSFEFAAFAVDDDALDRVRMQLAGGGEPRRAASGNAVLRDPRAGSVADRVRLLLRVLFALEPDPRTLSAASSQLLLLAARLDQAGAGAVVERPAPPSRRRAVVRRVEEWLDVHPGEPPSIPALCSLAGVSERTLEYAFREHFGMTPARYVKLRRLNRVRRELEAAAPEGSSVTAVALRSGFFDLGRFAGEYRALFRERPSETLRRAAARQGAHGRARPGPSASPLVAEGRPARRAVVTARRGSPQERSVEGAAPRSSASNARRAEFKVG